MVSICFYFHVHQPYRLRNYTLFDIGKNQNYYDDAKNKAVMQKIAKKCYLPTNNLLLGLINKHNGKFKVSFSITGVILEQFEKYAPEVLESFKQLADTGCVEFLSETYYHSLAYIYSKEEFREQVLMHRKRMKELFNQEPTVFRNTELIFNNELSKFVEDMGYEAILAEGADHILHGRSPNFIYNSVSADNIKVLLKNYRLSDDVAFRFSDKGWQDHPLTAEKYAQWVNAVNGNGELVNLFMDYETFGEHQWEDTGIFKFMEHLPEELLKHPDNEFLTVGEAARKYESKGRIDAHSFVSWADIERDLSAWLGNGIQNSSIMELYNLEKFIKSTNDLRLLEHWRRLTTSDHFYYMCTKWFADGDVHKYFNPYDSPYDAFIVFMNILNDLTLRIKQRLVETNQGHLVEQVPKLVITDNPSVLLERSS